MGKLGILVLFAMGACKPMYGDPPQKLRNPEPVPHGPDLPGDDQASLTITDTNCDLITTRTPAKRETAAAEVYIDRGDEKLRNWTTAPPAAKGGLIIDSIDEYSAALRKDPFNAQATLKLALAYDKVVRKGCVMAMLRRLDQLAQNPKFKREAESAIDELEQQSKWFAPYRKDALRAVGRTGP
jgi:hypothetical protein